MDNRLLLCASDVDVRWYHYRTLAHVRLLRLPLWHIFQSSNHRPFDVQRVQSRKVRWLSVFTHRRRDAQHWEEYKKQRRFIIPFAVSTICSRRYYYGAPRRESGYNKIIRRRMIFHRRRRAGMINRNAIQGDTARIFDQHFLNCDVESSSHSEGLPKRPRDKPRGMKRKVGARAGPLPRPPFGWRSSITLLRHLFQHSHA